MGIKLYPHNEKAYRAARKTLDEKMARRCGPFHGDGQVHYCFQVLYGQADKTVCWLSPSEYTFKTQIEKLRATGTAMSQNIEFYTYEKLMMMSEAEIAELQQDMAIYDEFHCKGAEMWSLGVERFRRMCPTLLLLGLTAVSARYLYFQRDMAKLLFGGCAAGEMTQKLDEARRQKIQQLEQLWTRRSD